MTWLAKELASRVSPEMLALRKARRDAHLTVAQVAQGAGIHPSTLQSAETGKRAALRPEVIERCHRTIRSYGPWDLPERMKAFRLSRGLSLTAASQLVGGGRQGDLWSELERGERRTRRCIHIQAIEQLLASAGERAA